MGRCELCGEMMPRSEEMFKYHGLSGPCPKPPLKEEKIKMSDLDFNGEDAKLFWTLFARYYDLPTGMPPQFEIVVFTALCGLANNILHEKLEKSPLVFARESSGQQFSLEWTIDRQVGYHNVSGRVVSIRHLNTNDSDQEA